MKKLLVIIALCFVYLHGIKSQDMFKFGLYLKPIKITNLQGLHSFAFGQDKNGLWLIIGGRKDGLHARQPFNAFPESYNNTDMYVIDAINQKFWSAPLSSLPSSISEQLQSTNMNFHQNGDTLYIMGGYGFSKTKNDHTTYSNLTSIIVSKTIDAIVNGSSFQEI